MPLNLPRAQASGVEREDLLIERRHPTLALLDQLGFEAAVAVPGELDIELTGVALEGLVSMAVAVVAAISTGRIVFLVAEMVSQFGL